MVIDDGSAVAAKVIVRLLAAVSSKTTASALKKCSATATPGGGGTSTQLSGPLPPSSQLPFSLPVQTSCLAPTTCTWRLFPLTETTPLAGREPGMNGKPPTVNVS